jgi:hypothetical protein
LIQNDFSADQKPCNEPVIKDWRGFPGGQAGLATVLSTGSVNDLKNPQ